MTKDITKAETMMVAVSIRNAAIEFFFFSARIFKRKGLNGPRSGRSTSLFFAIIKSYPARLIKG
jgi:hypothetical protein